jgi:hypothetical protein
MSDALSAVSATDGSCYAAMTGGSGGAAAGGGSMATGGGVNGGLKRAREEPSAPSSAPLSAAAAAALAGDKEAASDWSSDYYPSDGCGSDEDSESPAAAAAPAPLPAPFRLQLASVSLFETFPERPEVISFDGATVGSAAVGGGWPAALRVRELPGWLSKVALTSKVDNARDLPKPVLDLLQHKLFVSDMYGLFPGGHDHDLALCFANYDGSAAALRAASQLVLKRSRDAAGVRCEAAEWWLTRDELFFDNVTGECRNFHIITNRDDARAALKKAMRKSSGGRHCRGLFDGELVDWEDS